MYHNGDYFLQEPFPDAIIKREPDMIIEKLCWKVLKFMPQSKDTVQWNDVLRFGRVTFKVTELVLTQDEIEKAQKAIELLQNGIF